MTAALTFTPQSVRSQSGTSTRHVTPSNHPRVLFTGYERDPADEHIVTSLGKQN